MSVAESCPPLPHRPVLRRLVDILPAAAPAMVTPPLRTALPATDPAASVLAERVLRAAVEILGGRRPAQQLSAVLRPELLAYLASLQLATGHLEPRMRKVLAQQHTCGALEAVGLVTLNTGVRALAARFDKQVDDHGSRWQCTALQMQLTTGDLATRRGRHTRRP
ncbi:MAG: Rv3235 family protein [Pseudonocardiaceae bacterium]